MLIRQDWKDYLNQQVRKAKIDENIKHFLLSPYYYYGETKSDYCKRIQSLLLELNSNYKFEYRWKRFFAYIKKIKE